MTNDSDGAALLPCPFCGIAMEHLVGRFFHPGAFGDEECALSGKVFDCRQRDRWNRRVVLKSHGQAFDAAGVREACAKVAEQLDMGQPWSTADSCSRFHTRNAIVAAIRALPIPEAPAPDDETFRFAQQIVGLANSLQGRDALDSEIVSVKLIRAVAMVVNGEAFRRMGLVFNTEAPASVEPVACQPIETVPIGEYVLFHFDGPFNDTECPGVSVGKKCGDGRYWLTAIWASSTSHHDPVGWSPIPQPARPEPDTIGNGGEFDPGGAK